MKAVILAGGFGTRLYPLSTEEKPKQFVNLIGEGTLFQQTVRRLSFLDPADIYVATNKDYVDLVKEQAPEIPSENVIVEPAMRNTATCIGFAAAMLSKTDPDEVMAVVYADHLVRDIDEFVKKLRAAEKLAQEENTLNIIEVEAQSPNINLGYVHMGKRLREIDGTAVHEFKEFKEKPDLETAKKYIKSGEYLWNTGFYVWRIEKILEEFKRHHAETYERLMKMKHDPGLVDLEYPQCENISIDYAVMEKVDPSEVRIIPAILGWSDIGTFETLFSELEKNGDTERIEKFKQIKEEQ
ncbi:MAG: mannose-1-phosphate guanylyltransferase [Patescibacteria group bacterium]|nr:mannose-1-phosphate guanylyltransferase [Patescibacteria group bacterium]